MQIPSADANDEAQFAELYTQGELTRRAWEKDVQARLNMSLCHAVPSTVSTLHAIFLEGGGGLGGDGDGGLGNGGGSQV